MSSDHEFDIHGVHVPECLLCRAEQAERERDEARAEVERLREANAHWQAEHGRVVIERDTYKARYIAMARALGEIANDAMFSSKERIVQHARAALTPAPTGDGPKAVALSDAILDATKARGRAAATPVRDTYVCPSCRRTVPKTFHLCRDDGHPYNTPASGEGEGRS